MESKSTVSSRKPGSSDWQLLCPDCGQVLDEAPDFRQLTVAVECKKCHIIVKRII